MQNFSAVCEACMTAGNSSPSVMEQGRLFSRPGLWCKQGAPVTDAVFTKFQHQPFPELLVIARRSFTGLIAADLGEIHASHIVTYPDMLLHKPK